jgi:hypothetical protein
MWVLKWRFSFFPNYVKLYRTSTILWPSIFDACFTTRNMLSADHGGQRLWPIPSPAARRRPSQVRRCHPHTMGDDAYAWLCLISSGALAVSHPPPRPTTYFLVLFLGEMSPFLPSLLLSSPLLPSSLPSCCCHCHRATAAAAPLPLLLPPH